MSPENTDSAAHAADVLRTWLADSELEWHEEEDRLAFQVVLPGQRKLQTPVRVSVTRHAVEVYAFVCRKPDENFVGVYRWLLERNLRMFAVAFAVDASGDIYLSGSLPHAALTPDDVDQLMGSVLTYSDESFNTILELGFASAIRKEWEWRVSRGESTRNLEAFRGWLETDPS